MGESIKAEYEGHETWASDSDLGNVLQLSPREQEIVRLVAIGYPTKTIAGILEISPWTVSTHVRRIFNKMSVHGRAEMIAKLAQAGFCFAPPHKRMLFSASRRSTK